MMRLPSASICVVSLLAIGACRERPGSEEAHAAVKEMPSSPTEPGVAPRMYAVSAPSSFVDLVANARHGVVAIRSATPVKSGPAAMFPGAPETTADVALGTGFLVEAKGVYVVTTDTIAAAAPDLRVVLDDTTDVAAKVVGRDIDLDIALLSIDLPAQPGSRTTALAKPIALGSSADIKLGEWIAVLGNPFGEEVTVTTGVLSSTGREAAGSLMQDRGMSYRTFRMFMQTDARIHRGNSGGPVLDTAGQIIGMAVATSDRVGELSFVLPIDRITEVVKALRDRGRVERSWLGVKVKPVTADLANSLGLPAATGAYVTEVLPGSPAIKAALRAGDVILEWNEHTADNRTLPWLVAETPAGKPNTVVVWRNKMRTVVSVVSEALPQ
jgi:serine protease Do